MRESDYASAVDDAIRITAAELRPWVKASVGDWPPDRNGKIEPTDPSYLISVMLGHWQRFAGALGPEGRTLVNAFKDARNHWAHHRPFDPLDTFRAIDTCRLLLRAIGSARQAELIDAAQAILYDMGPRRSPREGDTIRSADALLGPPSEARHRKASSEAFREELWEHRFDDHVAPINRLVDDLIAQHPDRWMPYIAPYHGGINAEVLLLFQDPGRMTVVTHGGSGFIGCENNDPTAELLAQCLDDAGVGQSEVSPWNSYPWFLPDQSDVTVARQKEGLEPLRQLLGLLPRAHTVVTGGRIAHDTWGRFTGKYPGEAGGLRHMKTFHTSGRGITNGGHQTKADGVADVVRTLREAARRPTPRT